MLGTSDEKIKDIINRHIVQAKIMKDQLTPEREASERFRRSIMSCEQLVMDFVEMHTNHQIQLQQKLVRE